MGSPSEILVSLETDKGGITRVQVGGYAVLQGEMEVEV
jgi:predicted PhzF superfamily epimerase YddE/YHI9